MTKTHPQQRDWRSEQALTSCRSTTQVETRRVMRICERPQAEARGHRHQVGKRVGLHLAHHLTSVRLDGDLADAELAADLLVQQTGDDQRHHLAFARRE